MGFAAAGVGSGVAQASLEPHASKLLRLANLEVVDVWGGAADVGLGGCEVGWERLKAVLFV